MNQEIADLLNQMGISQNRLNVSLADLYMRLKGKGFIHRDDRHALEEIFKWSRMNIGTVSAAGSISRVLLEDHPDQEDQLLKSLSMRCGVDSLKHAGQINTLDDLRKPFIDFKLRYNILLKGPRR